VSLVDNVISATTFAEPPVPFKSCDFQTQKMSRKQIEGIFYISRWCHWIFQGHISFRPYHDPGVDSVHSENEYQEHSWG